MRPHEYVIKIQLNFKTNLEICGLKAFLNMLMPKMFTEQVRI